MTPGAVYTPLGFFGVLAVAFLTAHWLVGRWPLLAEKTVETGSRYGTLDGLRGLLAMTVMVHHCSIQYLACHGAAWKTPRSFGFEMAGRLPVQLFFMITGFLFWTRVLEKGVEWRSLLRGRAFRMGPMVTVATVAAMFLVMIDVGAIEGPILQPILQLFTLGGWQILEFNGRNFIPYSAGVTWTLRYEWLFYLALPFLAWFAKGRRTLILLAAYVPVHIFSPYPETRVLGLFGVGMLAAWLIHREVKVPKFPTGALGSGLVIGLLAVAMVVKPIPLPIRNFGITSLCFWAFLQGETLFGLLKTRAALVLGHASYSIYLLHGPILYLGLRSLLLLPNMDLFEVWRFWLVCCVLAAMVVIVSSWTYLRIELPWIARGKSIRVRSE